MERDVYFIESNFGNKSSKSSYYYYPSKSFGEYFKKMEEIGLTFASE